VKNFQTLTNLFLLGAFLSLSTAVTAQFQDQGFNNAVCCEIAGTCLDESGRATLGENLISFPYYDEQEGLRNSEIVRGINSGHEN